ncbi:response regulator [Sphingobacterium multivorum]|uniref:response regulator n=1 Tax=Sphingobacterium multivorum TaxID=28454 RepID=UPI003DA55694
MKKKIVICDDELLILDVLTIALESDSVEVISTSKSTELIALIEIVQPDLLIIDLMMPWLTGDELVRELKTGQKYSHMPIIMMSASARAPRVADECGADAFLAKPFELDDLYDLVEKVMYA